MLVCWADDISTNLGVRALAHGARGFVQQAFPGAQVEFQSFGAGSSPEPVTERAILKAFLNPAGKMSTWLSSYDLLLDMRAGDSFSDIYGIRRVISMSLFAEIARRRGVPVALGPQTIGPFSSRLGNALGKRALSMAKLVFARDSISANYAASMGREVDSRTSDVVFCIPQPIPGPTADIGFNISGLLWQPNPHVDHLRYREDVIRLCGKLVEAGRTVTLFAHVLDSADKDNDLPAVEAVQESMKNEVSIFVPTSLDEVRSFVSGCQLVIGSRMHACLNSLSVGTPAISLSYSRKFEPLLMDLGWVHNVDLKTPEDPVGAVFKIISQENLSQDLELALAKAKTSISAGVEALRVGTSA